MSVAAGPNVVSNGLVFEYDMSNTQRSWKGAPTTNIFGSNLLTTTSSRSISSSAFLGTYKGWETTGIGTDNPRTVLFNGSISVAASTYYTLSCLYWSSNDQVRDLFIKFSDSGWTESTYYIQPFTSQATLRNGSYSITDLGSGWKYCVGTFQTLASTSILQQLFFDNDIPGVVIFTSNFQLEQNLFATPFSNGARSTTQAIVDLTGNNTVTANSLTYASDGTFSFNGALNTIGVNNTNIPPTTNFTISSWVNCTNVAGSNNIVSRNGPYFMRIVASKVRFNVLTDTWLFQVGTTTLSNNTWYNLTMTYNGTAFIGYINGTQEFSVAKTGTCTSNGGLVIGYTTGGEDAPFSGKIASVSIYNHTLSATEVSQNFNALRGRYGI
jgi:hypothetical protein